MRFKYIRLLVVTWCVPLFAKDLVCSTYGGEVETVFKGKWHISSCTQASTDVTALLQTWVQHPNKDVERVLKAENDGNQSSIFDDTLGADWLAYNKTIRLSRAETILDAFNQADTNQDDRISAEEISEIYNYIAPGTWNESTKVKLMQHLDKLIPDGFLQRAEFFYWFEWPDMSTSLNFSDVLNGIDDAPMMPMITKIPTPFVAMPQRKANHKIVRADDIVNLFGGCFEDTSDYTTSVQILFFFSNIDTDGNTTISIDELHKAMTILEPKSDIRLTRAVMNMLDTSNDTQIQRREFFRWFTPELLGDEKSKS